MQNKAPQFGGALVIGVDGTAQTAVFTASFLSILWWQHGQSFMDPSCFISMPDMDDLSPVFIGHESPQQSHDILVSLVADICAFASLFFIGHESPLQHEQSHDVFASVAAVV
jgi:hypothetical protein